MINLSTRKLRNHLDDLHQSVFFLIGLICGTGTNLLYKINKQVVFMHGHFKLFQDSLKKQCKIII